MRGWETTLMLNSRRKHQQDNIGFSILSTRRREECTWPFYKHKYLIQRKSLTTKYPADQMDMHKKTGEMVFSTLANASTTSSKLQVSLNNVQNQLKLEKVSYFAKDNRIKSLEELVLKIGYDPSNVKESEEILKKKNVDIESLRKKLKLLAIEDSWAKEMVEMESEKEEMLKLIME
jgi:hypothetical protein